MGKGHVWNVFVRPASSWKSEVQNGSQWAKVKVLGRAALFLETPGENTIPHLLQHLEAALIPWSVASLL